jgi:hypothetical protein
VLVNPHDVATVRDDPELDHDSRVAVLAALVIWEVGGPLADELVSKINSPADGFGQRVLGFLRDTLAWPVAQELLERE